ncbi:MAG: TIM barrel protein, partial [Acidobacteriota bacterium]
FDVYHVAASDPDVLSALRRTASSIGHIQVAGVPARAEPDEGTVNYREVFRTIREIGYDGWIGCEYRPRTTPEAGLGWIDAFGGRESLD